MKKKYINNHFLQKGLAKNFALNKIIKWKRYQTDEGGEFHIDKTPNAKQPISKQNFYSEKIETGMNALESAGIRVFRKIAFEAQTMKNVKLSRKELITLRFYSLLTSARTPKLRENIKSRTGDSLFNKLMEKDGRDSQDIQEEKIILILKYWQSNKQKITRDFQKRYEELIKVQKNPGLKENLQQVYDDLQKNAKVNMTVESSTLENIYNHVFARLVVFKFQKPKLFFQEAFSFTEQNRVTSGILLSFVPIASNVGFALYFNPLISNQKSIIFHNDISYPRHKVDHINIEQIKQKQNIFLEKNTNIFQKNSEELKNSFWLWEASKYFSKRDTFIYEVLEEVEEVVDVCNAMSLVHNKDHIFIYQNEKHIHDAERKILEKGIFRIEDYS